MTRTQSLNAALIIALPVAVVLGATPTSTPASAKDAAGLQAVCDTCHGANGVTKGGLIPKLAGQRVKYLEKQLRDFRTAATPGAKPESLADIAGSRSHPKIKVDFANLTDGQIGGLATAFAGEACRNPVSPPLAAPVRAKTCVLCHDDKETSHGSWVARLSGQNKLYLTNQIYALQIAKRQGGNAHNVTRRHPVMEDQVADLSPDEVAALAEYFSRRRCR